MSADLSEIENTIIGAFAACIVVGTLQPTIYLKNAAAQGLPLTMNPRVLYRGVGINLGNEMGQLSAQFGVTGSFKKFFPSTPLGQLSSAAAAGALVALYVSPCELFMIQQQRHGGGLLSTAKGVFEKYGVVRSLQRGLGLAIARDALMVCGMLGATPVIQTQLLRYASGSSGNGGSGGAAVPTAAATAVASLAASMLGGTVGALLSHPFDVLNTCLKGDLDRKTYGGVLDSARVLLREGGVKRLYNGGLWRTVNIALTVWIANECALKLPYLVKPFTRGVLGGFPPPLP